MTGIWQLRPRRVVRAGVAAALSLVPRRRRFAAAVLLSRPLVAFVRRTPQYRVLEDTAFNSGREIALHLLLHTLTAHGAGFDPPIAIDGYERLVTAHRQARGVLLVAVHTPLVLLMLRRFHEDGIAPFVVAADPGLRIAGTALAVETVQPSAASLLRIRNRLREGRLVCAMLDRAAHGPGARTTELDTAAGPVIFAPALLHVAIRCGAAVAFCEAHLHEEAVRGAITFASATSGADVEREYADFILSVVRGRAAGTPAGRFEHAAT